MLPTQYSNDSHRTRTGRPSEIAFRNILIFLNHKKEVYFQVVSITGTLPCQFRIVSLNFGCFLTFKKVQDLQLGLAYLYIYNLLLVTS